MTHISQRRAPRRGPRTMLRPHTFLRTFRSPSRSQCRFQAEAFADSSHPLTIAERPAPLHTYAKGFKLPDRLGPIGADQPVFRSVHRPVAQPGELHRVRLCPSPQAGPPPILGSIHQLRSQRISLHIAHDRQKMFIGLNWK
jgi:hypothetical protein